MLEQTRTWVETAPAANVTHAQVTTATHYFANNAHLAELMDPCIHYD